MKRSTFLKNGKGLEEEFIQRSENYLIGMLEAVIKMTTKDKKG
jgi:hypothetical protein